MKILFRRRVFDFVFFVFDAGEEGESDLRFFETTSGNLKAI